MLRPENDFPREVPNETMMFVSASRSLRRAEPSGLLPVASQNELFFPTAFENALLLFLRRRREILCSVFVGVASVGASRGVRHEIYESPSRRHFLLTIRARGTKSIPSSTVFAFASERSLPEPIQSSL